LPFVCRKCGSCCRGFEPQLSVEDLPKIAKHLGKTIEEIKKLHKNAYNKKFSNSPANCIFLNFKNQCLIYSMRPEPCRLYPLYTDFGAADVNCIGHKEFNRIVDAFFARRKYAALRASNNNTKNLRGIPKKKWQATCRTVKKARPSEKTFRLIMKLNKISM
jgi:Fe-S-cluster containining protein